MACLRNVIYSFLYSSILLEKLTLSNGTAFHPATFSIACNYFESMPPYFVSLAGANHTCEFKISEASGINPIESLKYFWRQLTISSLYQIAFLVSESTLQA